MGRQFSVYGTLNPAVSVKGPDSRISTNAVRANLAGPAPSQPPTPAAYRHRASNVNRSTASRSESPSRRCSTITVAPTDRRPITANRPMNRSSGNNRFRSRTGTRRSSWPAATPRRTGSPNPNRSSCPSLPPLLASQTKKKEMVCEYANKGRERQPDHIG